MPLDDHARTIHQVAASLHRQQHRETQSLTQRLARALSRAAMMTSVGAQNVEDGKLHALKPDSQLPAGTSFNTSGDLVTHVETFRVDNHLAVIGHAIARFELALDDEQGLGAARHHATLSGEELDELIKEWTGTLAHVVSVNAPWLGSPRTIERRRKEMGLRPSDGRELALRAA